jgi:hypothetical protein
MKSIKTTLCQKIAAMAYYMKEKARLIFDEIKRSNIAKKKR